MENVGKNGERGKKVTDAFGGKSDLYFDVKKKDMLIFYKRIMMVNRVKGKGVTIAQLRPAITNPRVTKICR